MIIEVVGKEIEKIKGDFESYLNGLNMVGEISYSQYSELYDEGTKQIQKAYELGKSGLEKENAELKRDNEGYEKDNTSLVNQFNQTSAQLIKAKEIIKKLISDNRKVWVYSDVREEAEQFLNSEVEK